MMLPARDTPEEEPVDADEAMDADRAAEPDPGAGVVVATADA